MALLSLKKYAEHLNAVAFAEGYDTAMLRGVDPVVWWKSAEEVDLSTLVTPKELVLQGLPCLPPQIAALKVTFRLRKDSPFYSRAWTPSLAGDNVNPLFLDKTLRLPELTGSAWKGLLRHAYFKMFEIGLPFEPDSPDTKTLADCLGDQALRPRADSWRQRGIRLFGTERKELARHLDELFGCQAAEPDEEEDSRIGEESEKEGTIRTFSTFFSKVRREILNPQNRTLAKSPAGRDPVTFEVVCGGEKGVFQALLVPEPSTRPSDTAGDLLALLWTLEYLFQRFGISARRNRGWGRVRVEKARWNLNAKTGKGKTLGQLRKSLGEEFFDGP